ncbi:hypothetical protein [Chryseolinea sp. H1M3-3]|uniref:hypothetical protein n=1 Tax=Chryseolinea sp. H1M3-3 TaxID=3034144 RepID=UPI0023EB0989|nr:hypothetical protein [Chryseolinea sp. H1M3-3]
MSKEQISVGAALIIFVFLATPFSVAQTYSRTIKFIDANFAVGDAEGSMALSFNVDKGLGKKKKIVVGVGGRLTSYLGKNQYYETAPARLTSGSTGPQVIFKENIAANIDTFLIKTAQVNSLNVLITLGYNFSEKLMVRFNIDAIGLSFGKNTKGNYINGSRGAIEAASPTTWNALLVSDNDRGSLNSEFFGRYLFNKKWAVKAGIQFHFTEYTTDTQVQQFPEANDRFRNKSLMFTAGLSYKL